MTPRIFVVATGYLLVLATPIVASAQENEEQKRAMDKIRKLAPEHFKKDAEEWLFEIGDEGAILGVSLTSSQKVSDSDLTLLRPFKKLKKLELQATKITDRGLENIPDLKELRILSLSQTQITDRGMQ